MSTRRKARNSVDGTVSFKLDFTDVKTISNHVFIF